MQETEIVQAAIQHLHELTGIAVHEVGLAGRDKPYQDPDTALELEIPGKKFFFWVDVKNEIRR